MRLLRYLLPAMILLFSYTTAVQAQGRGGRGNGEHTPVVPRGTVRPEVQLPEITGTPFAIESDWTGITLPDDLPSQADIQALLDDFDLPFSLEDLDLPGSSPEAYTALVGFGQSYLGITIDPFYAGVISGEAVDDTELPEELPVELETVTVEVPAEVQSLLENVTGIGYWGIYQNGAAGLYTASNCTADCSLTVDNLQLTLSNGSIGLYTVYQQSSITDDISAQNLILSTFPALARYELTSYAIEAGYTFTGYDTSVGTDFSGTGFLAGVTPSQNGQSLVYVIFGVGEGYIELMPR